MTTEVSTTAPYAALARVYERWTAENDYDSWLDHIERRLSDSGATTVLDVCCGTGTVAVRLQQLGYGVTGVDGSDEMLAVARRRLAPGTTLIHSGLPDGPALSEVFDAAVCTFDSVNYFAETDALSGLLRYVAAALRPGGIFIFDVNTQAKLAGIFGNSQFGDDRGDFAYVWRNRCTPADSRTEFLITLFERDEDDRFVRSAERHTQRWFSTAEITAAAVAAGFAVLATTEDYSERPATAASLRETWTLRRTDH